MEVPMRSSVKSQRLPSDVDGDADAALAGRRERLKKEREEQDKLIALDLQSKLEKLSEEEKHQLEVQRMRADVESMQLAVKLQEQDLHGNRDIADYDDASLVAVRLAQEKELALQGRAARGSAADYKRSEPDRPPASAPSGAAGGEPELVFHPMQPVHDQDPEMDQFRRQQRLMDDDERVARELAEMEDAKLARSFAKEEARKTDQQRKQQLAEDERMARDLLNSRTPRAVADVRVDMPRQGHGGGGGGGGAMDEDVHHDKDAELALRMQLADDMPPAQPRAAAQPDDQLRRDEQLARALSGRPVFDNHDAVRAEVVAAADAQSIRLVRPPMIVYDHNGNVVFDYRRDLTEAVRRAMYGDNMELHALEHAQPDAPVRAVPVDHPAPFPPLPADPKARKKEEKRRAELAERQRKENARLAKEHEKEAARIAKQQQRDDEARRKAHAKLQKEEAEREAREAKAAAERARLAAWNKPSAAALDHGLGGDPDVAALRRAQEQERRDAEMAKQLYDAEVEAARVAQLHAYQAQQRNAAPRRQADRPPEPAYAFEQAEGR